MHDWRTLRESVPNLNHSRHGRISYADSLDAVLRSEFRCGDNRRNDIPDMTNHLVSESRPRRIVHRSAVAERDGVRTDHLPVTGGLPVFGGQNPEDAFDAQRIDDIDIDDARFCMRAPHE